MTSSAFISYSRRQGALADRLELDLIRAGVPVWRDRTGIPPDNPDWWARIRQEIEKASHILLLASPDSAREDSVVWRELALANELDKRILILRVAGANCTLPESWTRRQLTSLDGKYWSELGPLLRHLDAPRPVIPSLVELLDRGEGTVAEAALQITGGKALTLAGCDYWKLPVEPSCYTMTWLVAPAKAAFRGPDRLAVLFRFAGRADRDTLPPVVSFLSANVCPGMWVVYVEGPKDKEDVKYDLPSKSPHVWQDGFNASVRALHLPFLKEQKLDIFLDCPAALVYAVAGQSRETARHRLYQFDQESTDGVARYRQVLGPPPA